MLVIVALSRENRHPYVDDMPGTNDHRYGRQIHVQQGARYGSPRRRNRGCGNGQHAETTVSIKILRIFQDSVIHLLLFLHFSVSSRNLVNFSFVENQKAGNVIHIGVSF